MSLLEQGECEPMKASLHYAACGLFLVFAAYNLSARLARGEGRHLVVNTVLYASVAAYEFQMANRHRKRC